MRRRDIRSEIFIGRLVPRPDVVRDQRVLGRRGAGSRARARPSTRPAGPARARGAVGREVVVRRHRRRHQPRQPLHHVAAEVGGVRGGRSLPHELERGGEIAAAEDGVRHERFWQPTAAAHPEATGRRSSRRPLTGAYSGRGCRTTGLPGRAGLVQPPHRRGVRARSGRSPGPRPPRARISPIASANASSVSLRLRLGRLDQQRLLHQQREVDRGRVVAEVEQALGQVERADAELAASSARRRARTRACSARS